MISYNDLQEEDSDIIAGRIRTAVEYGLTVRFFASPEGGRRRPVVWPGGMGVDCITMCHVTYSHVRTA